VNTIMSRSSHLCGGRWPQAITRAVSTAFAIAVLLTAFLAGPGALAATSTGTHPSLNKGRFSPAVAER
jgi:hypothetical protein